MAGATSGAGCGHFPYGIPCKGRFELFREAHLWRMHAEIKALSAALAKIPFLKANYNPNQPRVPRGNADGGQWTSGNDVRGNSEVRHVITIPDSSGKVRNTINIFVGGGRDSSFKNVKDSRSLNKDTYGYNYYTAWDAEDEIIEFISSIPKVRLINLIGHSYGGDTAAKVAVKIPKRINNLVTIDPVSDRNKRASYKDISNSVKFWINVNAVGDPNTSYFEGLEAGNFIAGLGDSWDDTPGQDADIHIKAPYDHANFDAMMSYGTIKPQSVLNQQ